MQDIQGFAMEWAPPELPREVLDNLKGVTLTLQQGAEVLTNDYEENGDRFYDRVEWELQSQDWREKACKVVSNLIDEINQIYIQHPGALEDMGLDDHIKKIVKLQPDSITIVTLDEAYASLCKKSKKGNYVLLKQCEKILKRLKGGHS